MQSAVLIFLVTLTGGMVASAKEYCGPCKYVDTVEFSFKDKQPLFASFLPNTEQNRLLDNVCWTVFQNNATSYTLYTAQVFCDGSYVVTTSLYQQWGKGTFKSATPMKTATDRVVGYTGCDNYVFYQCVNHGASCQPFLFGASFSCSPLALSCLRKVEEVIDDKGLDFEDLYVLPMKLPNRCVTKQACTVPPSPFTPNLLQTGVAVTQV